MLKLVRKQLLEIVDNIDAGNSNINEEDAIELATIIKSFTDKTERISKYEACRYLRISRATFDNYIREGKLPKGKKTSGFNELSWTKKELDEAMRNNFKQKSYSHKNKN